MRGMMAILAALGVMALGFWAYTENYKTQEAQRDLRALHMQIGVALERLDRLEAEWAYQRRPDRLADLAELNFDRLGLLPLSPEAFGDLDDVLEPIPEILPITNPIDINSIPPSTEEDPL